MNQNLFLYAHISTCWPVTYAVLYRNIPTTYLHYDVPWLKVCLLWERWAWSSNYQPKALVCRCSFGQLMFREEKTEDFEVLLLNRRELLRLLEQRRPNAAKIIINIHLIHLFKLHGLEAWSMKPYEEFGWCSFDIPFDFYLKQISKKYVLNFSVWTPSEASPRWGDRAAVSEHWSEPDIETDWNENNKLNINSN